MIAHVQCYFRSSARPNHLARQTHNPTHARTQSECPANPPTHAPTCHTRAYIQLHTNRPKGTRNGVIFRAKIIKPEVTSPSDSSSAVIFLTRAFAIRVMPMAVFISTAIFLKEASIFTRGVREGGLTLEEE